MVATASTLQPHRTYRPMISCVRPIHSSTWDIYGHPGHFLRAVWQRRRALTAREAAGRPQGERQWESQEGAAGFANLHEARELTNIL